MHLFNSDDDVAVPNAMAVLDLCGPVAQMAQIEGDALGKPVKSTIPVPREKCGHALNLISCHKLVQNSKSMLSV